MSVETILQQCSSCKRTQIQADCFSINTKGLFAKGCKVCQSKRNEKKAEAVARSAKYYTKNKIEIAEKTKIRAIKYKDRISLYQMSYRNTHKDKTKEYNALYKTKNKDYITKESKEYYIKNLDKVKEYRLQNKEHITKLYKEYYIKNKIKVAFKNKTYRNNKRHHCFHKTERQCCKICSPNAYLVRLVRKRVSIALKSNKNKRSLEYLGCDGATFREHLQQSFEDGMTWENQGEWEIDHIVPVAYKQDGIEPSIDEVVKRLHYLNCQAMWKIENIKKGNRYCGDYHSD
jgi:hypothetical protein